MNEDDRDTHVYIYVYNNMHVYNNIYLYVCNMCNARNICVRLIKIDVNNF